MRRAAHSNVQGWRLAVTVGLLWLVAVAEARPAEAWNDTGHQVIALIAWDTLPAPARARLVAMLRQAPADSRLAGLFSEDDRPLTGRAREFFRRAATWADLVRDLPEYHRPTWHHRDFFWTERHGRATDLPDLRVNPENLLDRLEHFRALLAMPDTGAKPRAIALAWMLHLVGDLHQPLHVSSRVTRREPSGDRGGNDFELGPRPASDPRPTPQTLHAYWDELVDTAYPRGSDERAGAHLDRAARQIMARHPRARMEPRVGRPSFEAWARESLRAAQAVAYPPDLARRREPPAGYRARASDVATERVALAGYRLGALLRELPDER